MLKEIAVFADVVFCLLLVLGALWTWFTYLFSKNQYGTTASKFIDQMEETVHLFTLAFHWVPVMTWTIGGAFVGTMTYFNTYFSIAMAVILGSVIVGLISLSHAKKFLSNHVGSIMS